MSGSRYSKPPLLQALDDGFDTIGAVEHVHLAKALAPGHEPGIEHRIGWVAKMEVNSRGVFSGSARPPASMP